MHATRLRSLQALGIFCGFAAGAWLGGAEAPIKLVNPDISPITVSLIMVLRRFPGALERACIYSRHVARSQ